MVFDSPLDKRPFCGFVSEGLEIRFCKALAFHENQGMDMPVGAVVVVNGGRELNLFADSLLKFEDGIKSESLKIRVAVAVFLSWSRADDNAVEGIALLRSLFNHPIDLLFGEFSIKTKKVSGN